MSILTLAQLRATKTRAEWRDDVIGVLTELGFSATSWQSGSVQRTIVEAIAYVGSILQSNVAALSHIAFNDDASGDALTAYSAANFANDRNPAVATRGYVRFTGGSSGPPYTIAASDAIVAATVGSATYFYRNVEEITVPASGYVDALVEAEETGPATKVANNTITSLVTVYAGVTVNNPAYGATLTWITVDGENEETDANLRLRNEAKWATLSVLTAIDDRYEYIARDEINNCRVEVDSTNPDGPGTLRVYLALETGAADSTDAANVQAAINAAYLGGGCTVAAAVAQSIAVTATVYYAPGASSAAVDAAVDEAIARFINAAPIGGYDYGTGENNIIDIEGLTRAMGGGSNATLFDDTDATDQAFVAQLELVRRVIVTTPAGDTAITAHRVATAGTITLTMVEASA